MENIKLNSSLRVTFILTFRTVITIIIIFSVKVFVIENANLILRPLNPALLQQRAISQSRTFEWFLIQACHPRSLIAGCHQCHHHDECDHSQAGLTTLGCFIFKSFINSSLFGGTQDESKSDQQAKQQSKIDYYL